MNYCIAISNIQYGKAYVRTATAEEALAQAEKLCKQRKIDWYEEEISDLSITSSSPEPHEEVLEEVLSIMRGLLWDMCGQDTGSLDYRELTGEMHNCASLLNAGFKDDIVAKVMAETTCDELRGALKQYAETKEESSESNPQTVPSNEEPRTSASDYQRKEQILLHKYGAIAEDFAPYDDDRRLVVNMLNQLLEACRAMYEVDNRFVRDAFNNAYKAQEKQMDDIVTRFTGKEYNGHRWVQPEKDGTEYIVSVAVDGRIDVTVRANSFEAAKAKAESAFSDADLADMEVIGVKPVNAEDEHGNFKDY